MYKDISKLSSKEIINLIRIGYELGYQGIETFLIP